MRLAALLLLVTGCAWSAALECAVDVLVTSGSGVAPAPGKQGECLPALYGPHVPLNADFDHALARAEPADGCATLTDATLSGAIVLLDFPRGCSPIDAAERAQARGALAALFVLRADQPFERASGGWLSDAPQLRIPVLLVSAEYAAAHLAGAARLRLRLAARVLVDGAPQAVELARERDAFFTYSLDAAAELTVVVSALAGEADVYGNSAASADTVALPPGLYNAQYWAARTGDELLQIGGGSAAAGGRRHFVFAVRARGGAAHFTIQVASGASALELDAGRPLRLAVGREQTRYLRHAVASGAAQAQPLRFALTVASGNATLWVCDAYHATPEAAGGSCAWSSEGRAEPIVDIAPTDRKALRCGGAAGCAYHLIVRARMAAALTAAVTRGAEPLALVDGAPQLGAVSAARPASAYTIRTTDGALALSATPLRGRVEVTVTEPARGRTYTLVSGAEGGSVARRVFAASELCADCDVQLRVAAVHDGAGQPGEGAFSLVAATPLAVVALLDGAPHLDAVVAGGERSFRMDVLDPLTDVRLALTPLSGNPDLFVSHVHARPNATSNEWSATAADGVDVLAISHAAPAMRACAAAGAADGAGCTLFVAVRGASASTFSLSAELSVANDGLRISAPASAAGSLVFSAAAFGAPLPFEARACRVHASEPADGCAPLSSDAVSGKVALIARGGGCTFVQKAQHAQAQGALAVLVSNNVDGPPVRMGAPLLPLGGAAVTIPAVMVSRADGERLRALLAAGAAVEVVLQQPGSRPVALLDGVPQQAAAEAAQLVFFTYRAPADATSVTFTVTPELGDPDLFLNNDGLPPTQTHYGWHASESGGDALTVRATDPRFCAGCVYHLGVYGFSPTAFAVLATSGGGAGETQAVSLQLGVPLTRTLAAGGWDYYTVLVEGAADGLRLSVTALTGDPDLYVSTDGRPTASAHGWAATEWGADTLEIAADAAGFRPGLFHVGVTGSTASTYSLVATAAADVGAYELLLAGRPQAVALAAHSWQYFRFLVGANASDVRFSVTPLVGDPDVYVTTDGSRPSLSHFQFRSDGLGAEEVRARAGDAGFCAGCAYQLGVYAFSAGTNFTLTASVEYARGNQGNGNGGGNGGGDGNGGGGGHGGGDDDDDSGARGEEGTIRLLADGVPAEGHAGPASAAYFRFFVDRTDLSIELTLSASAGDPDVYASFAHERPGPSAYEFKSSTLGSDALSISCFGAPFCVAAACSLHVGVHSFGGRDARFTLLARQYAEARVALLDGEPQRGALGADGWLRYTFTLADAATELRFALTPTFGDPDLYVSTTVEPTRDEYTWSATGFGADVLLLSAADPLWTPPPVTYRLAVHAFTAANFSLVAASAFAPTLLADGVPARGVVQAGGYQYFKVHMDEAATDVELTLTPLSGDPDLYASADHARPNRSHHQFAAESAQRDVLRVGHAEPAMAACAAGGQCVLYVSVYGAADAASSFQLVAALHLANRGMRVTEPPSVARLYESRHALFGAPLPFEGAPLALVAADPTDACAPLRNAAALAGAVALVERGVCNFDDKALAVQAAGAVAMVVSNSAGGGGGGGLVFMAATSMARAANVSVAAVMVSAADGASLRTALAASAVRVVLEQPGDRPRQLLDGRPQYGSVATFEMAYYAFSAGGSGREVTFSLTPLAGSVDLFVRRTSAADPLPPTQSFFERSSTRVGSLADSITIRPTDGDYCAACTYVVGVLGWSAAEFTLTAATAEAIVSLQDGVPHVSHVALGGGGDFYRVLVDDPTHRLRVLVTPLSGDPDLYVSTRTPRPSAANHTWASTAFGADAVSIGPDDASYVVGPYYLGVYAFGGNATYTITALVAEDRCVTLVDGQPQQASLAARDWACFSLAVDAAARALTISVTPLVGDPDVYVTTDGSRPSLSHFQFKGTHSGTDEITLAVGAAAVEPQACAGCVYQIGVYGFSATEFSVQATARAHRVLADSVPTTSALLAGTPVYFAYYVEHDDLDIELRLTRLGGGASLRASFGSEWPTAETAQFEIRAETIDAEARLTIGAADARRCAPAPCALYLALEASPFGPARASLLAYQASVRATTLISGRPQQDSLDADSTRYYALAVPANASSVTIAVTPTSGDPDLFVSNVPGARPGPTEHIWLESRAGADALRISANDPHWCAAGCTYTIGVVAWSASTYALVASYGFDALPAVLALQDGSPVRASVAGADDAAFFSFDIARRDESIVVAVTPFSGDPDLYASFVDTRPQRRSSAPLYSATALGGDVLRISHFDGGFCPASTCTLFIGVSAFHGNATFSVVATQASERAIALLDGVPQRAALEPRAWQYFTFEVGAAADRATFALTALDGDPDLYVSTDAFPTAAAYGWKAALGGSDSLTIGADDPAWCAPCGYRVGVHAYSATNFSIVASTGARAALLEDGVPRVGAVAAGSAEYYRVLVDDPATDLHIVLTPLSGNPDLFVSHVHARPNATSHEFASTAAERDAVSISHAAPSMRACVGGGAASCEWYIGVHAASAAAYVLVARLAVVTRGLRVDAPAAAAGSLAFSNAVFGPPLPFEGVSTALALAEPADGCAPLSSDAVSGKVALIARGGGCTFVQKAQHAQASGALALLVSNNEDGPPVRMGASSDQDAAGLRVAAVMVSRADGERLRALLAAGEVVRVTLQQPGERPIALLDGMPQRGSVAAAQMAYFQLHVGADAPPDADITFTVLADYGDPDLYVSSDGLPPTQTHYAALASRAGADSLTLAPGEAGHCVGCVYTIGVYGWLAANFTLTAATATATTTLQLGQPVSGRLGAHSYSHYRVFVAERSHALRITLLALSGDPDVYVSTTVLKPDAAHHTWASSGVGDEGILIDGADARFGPGLFFIGVGTPSGRNSSYTLSAVTSGELRLFHGAPQRASTPADGWQYFAFAVGADATRVTVTVTPSAGDPDLYVSAGTALPTLAAHTWASALSGGDTLTIDAADPAWCPPPCTYRVGVYGWSASEFQIAALAEGREAAGGCGGGAMALQDGVAVYALATANASRCFRLPVDEPAASLTVTLTPFGGRANLTLGFGGARALEGELRGVLVSQVGWSGAALLLAPDCAPPPAACFLHARVDAASSFAFSLGATRAGAGRALALVPGRPQYGALAAGGWAYYSFATRAATNVAGGFPAVTISLTPAFGSARLFVRADGRVPTAHDSTWSSSAGSGEQLLLSADEQADACAGDGTSCRLLLAVLAGSATNFSISAYAHGDVVTLQEGAPVAGLARAGRCQPFAIGRAGSEAALALALSLTALSGEPSVYVGAAPNPTNAAHLPGGALRGGASGGELRVELQGEAARAPTLYLSVCSGPSGLPARFVLAARLHAALPQALLDGVPTVGSVADGRIAQYRVRLGPRATRLQVSATPRSGDLALLVSARGGGHDGNGTAGGALSRATWRSAAPGVNTVLARAGEAGWCTDCEMAIGVLGQPAADFTLLATVEQAYALRDGEPQTARLELVGGAAAQRAAYFGFALDEAVGFSIAVTVLMGSAPSVFISATDPHPSAASFAWSPAGADDAGGGGIRFVRIAPDDAAFCVGCTYHVAVVAYEPCTVVVAALSDRRGALSLVNGLPLKQTSRGGEYLYFQFEAGADAGELVIAAQPEVGARGLEVYVAAGGAQPSAAAHGWASTDGADGEGRVVVRPTDAGYCGRCAYSIAVFAPAAATFSVVATSASGATVLPLGLPSQQRVEAGAAAFFKVDVEPRGASVLLSFVPMRAPLRVLLATASAQPSEETALAAFDVPLGAPKGFSLDAARLRQWCPSAVLAADACSLSIAVRAAAADDATFAIGVTQGATGVLLAGLPQLAHAEPAQPALFSIGADAASQEHLMISVSIAPPPDGAAAPSQSVVVEMLVSTSGYLPSAGAAQWRALADTSQGGSASVLIARNDSRACASCRYHVTLLASARVNLTIVASTAAAHTLLVEGAAVYGQVARGEYARFKTYVNRAAAHNLVVTVSPCAGNPDLYVSDLVESPGLPDAYTFASAQPDQIERLLLTPVTLGALGDVLYISVYGQTDAAFAIAVADSLDADAPSLAPAEDGGVLAVRELAAKSATLSWSLAHAPVGSSADEALALESTIRYSVQLARQPAAAAEGGSALLLYTQCGLSRGAREIGAAMQRDANRRGALELQLGGLEPGTAYQVNVVASRKGVGIPLLYRPLAFSTAAARASVGAGGVLAILLGLLLGCLLAGLGALLVRRRKQLAALALLDLADGPTATLHPFAEYEPEEAGGAHGGGNVLPLVASPLFGMAASAADVAPLAPSTPSYHPGADGIGDALAASLGRQPFAGSGSESFAFADSADPLGASPLAQPEPHAISMDSDGDDDEADEAADNARGALMNPVGRSDEPEP